MRRYADDPCAVHPRVAHELADWLTTHSEEITRLRAEVERLRMTDEDHDALAWAIAVTTTIYDDPIGPIRRETLRDLARRHERHAAPIV
jgi:hypothetical protein